MVFFHPVTRSTGESVYVLYKRPRSLRKCLRHPLLSANLHCRFASLHRAFRVAALLLPAIASWFVPLPVLVFRFFILTAPDAVPSAFDSAPPPGCPPLYPPPSFVLPASDPSSGGIQRRSFPGIMACIVRLLGSCQLTHWFTGWQIPKSPSCEAPIPRPLR